MKMDETARKQLVADWQKKHGVADNDPLFAAVELFDIYAASLGPKPSGKPADPPGFGEFRDTLEKLDQISKSLTNVAQDLTKEIRKSLPRNRNTGSSGITSILLLAAFVAAAAYITYQYILQNP